MLKKHDLTKLEARGFYLQDERIQGQLDGISATLPFDESLRVQIFQGCEGIYELQGQGRGRPKKHVMVDVEWFTPSWYVDKRDGNDWTTLARGSAETVDVAVSDALRMFHELFPNVPVPAGVA